MSQSDQDVNASKQHSTFISDQTNNNLLLLERRRQSIDIYSAKRYSFYQKVKLIFFVKGRSHSIFALFATQQVRFEIGNT